MKKEIKNDIIVGYTIGKSIQIHGHIYHPEEWLVTIRDFDIFGKVLCKKTCTEDEIARYVNLILVKKQRDIERIIADVIPFT